MTYVSWAALYEGESDANYLEIIIRRLMEEIIWERQQRNSEIPEGSVVRLQRQSIDEVAREACDARDAFHLLFIHADTGGRALEMTLEQRSLNYCKAINELCGWPPVRCIVIAPRHETEAWLLADPDAVTSALGYSGSPSSVELPEGPQQAERLTDPKAVLERAITNIRGRRRRAKASDLYASIAQRQSFAILRQSASFTKFECALLAALRDIGSI